MCFLLESARASQISAFSVDLESAYACAGTCFLLESAYASQITAFSVNLTSPLKKNLNQNKNIISLTDMPEITDLVSIV